MGQAKRRGKKEERITQAIERDSKNKSEVDNLPKRSDRRIGALLPFIALSALFKNRYYFNIKGFR